VILGVEGEARSILERAGAGVCIEPEDAGSLARAVLELRDSPEGRARYGRTGQEFVRRRHDRRALARRLAVILESAAAVR
jgi:glycosyltransferase involved in cell wall biosynthesis